MHPGRIHALFGFLHMFGMAFIATTYVPLLLEVGLTLADVALINLVFWLGVSLAELPTGMLADGRSRAWSVRVGQLIFAGGMLIYSLLTGFWTAILAEAVIAAGFAFISGASSAWLADALKKRGESDQLQRWFGTSAAFTALGTLAGGLVGAVIGAYSLRLSLGFSALVGFLTYLFVRAKMGDEGEPAERLTELEAFRSSWKALGRSYALKWSVAAAALFGLVMPFNYYWTPFFSEMVGQAGLGYVWVPLYGTMALAGWAVRSSRIGQGCAGFGVAVGLLLAGLGLSIAGGLPGFFMPLAACMLHEFGRGIYQPFISTFTQRRLESGYRATFGSLQSLLGRAGYAVILLGLWLATYGMTTTRPMMSAVWLVMGGLLAAAATVLFLARPKPTRPLIE